jgi:hypothetical protein
VFLSEHGRGRVVYFPWDIDRTYWDVLSPDHFLLLRNAVDWASNEPRPLEVTGPGVLDVSLWEQKSSLTAHVVNLTNPMMMKGPIREILPVGAQTVRIRIPQGRRIAAVKLLVAGGQPRYQTSNGAIVLEIPSIALHEVVAVDWA